MSKRYNYILTGYTNQFHFRARNPKTGQFLNLDTDVSGIAVGMYYKRGGEEVDKWSLNVLAGFTQKLFIKDQAAYPGEFYVVLDRDKVAGKKEGEVYFEIKIELPDAQYDNSKDLPGEIKDTDSDGRFYYIQPSKLGGEASL